MDYTPITIHGRGSPVDPKNRFERAEFVVDEDVHVDPSERPAPTTVLLRDHSKSIIATNDSPDVSFDASINVYRGCEHGCVYCFARPTHEYLGMSAGLDFESKIVVKFDAPQLLRKELCSPRWKPQRLAMSGVTDCYQPIERKLELTRKCLEVFLDLRSPVTIITKNHLVTRDIDLLSEMAKFDCIKVCISITTLDPTLTMKMEPRTSVPARRLAAIEKLTAAGVPVTVLNAPIIPGLNDHEMADVLTAARNAGATNAGHVLLRLPWAVKDLFEDWLERHFPDRKDKILNRVRELRGGKLYDAKFGERMKGQGIWAEQFSQMFEMAKRKAGFVEEKKTLSLEHFRQRDGKQLTLF